MRSFRYCSPIKAKGPLKRGDDHKSVSGCKSTKGSEMRNSNLKLHLKLNFFKKFKRLKTSKQQYILYQWK